MKKEANSPINGPEKEPVIQHKIHVIRNQSVILDFDLAALYEVETRVLKQAVRRNIERFPEDFMFELERTEYNTLRSQTVILESGRGKHSKYAPFAFTELFDQLPPTPPASPRNPVGFKNHHVTT
jgi:ORF6N domain